MTSSSSTVWDHAALARFNWVFHDCTSFQPYLTEIPKTQSMFATSSTATLSSARAVLASLNSKAVKAFYKLLEYQHNHMRESDFQGTQDWLGRVTHHKKKMKNSTSCSGACAS
eukprot:m.213947 g.213947  ORF g.213947 m.213947 type:complete len:113 (+) comp10763_c0_seq24:1724-2062(+)